MFTFLDLPRELRNEIYVRYAPHISNEAPFEAFYPVSDLVYHEDERPMSTAREMVTPKRDALAYTCRQIFTEYLEEQQRRKRQVVHSFAFRFQGNELQLLAPRDLNGNVRAQATHVRFYADVSKAIAIIESRKAAEVLNSETYTVGDDDSGNWAAQRAVGVPFYICEKDVRFSRLFYYTFTEMSLYTGAYIAAGREFFEHISRLLRHVRGFTAMQHLELRIRVLRQDSKYASNAFFLEALGETMILLCDEFERLSTALPTLKSVETVMDGCKRGLIPEPQRFRFEM